MSFRDEFAFRKALCLATDKAITSGFFAEAQLIDASLVAYRIRRFELVGSSGLLGWLKQERTIGSLEIEPFNELDLDHLKATIVSIIKTSSFWAENEDIEALIDQVQSARTFPNVIDLFG
jgi:hypothetical protein